MAPRDHTSAPITARRQGENSSPDATPGIPRARGIALFQGTKHQLPVADHAEGIYIWDTDGRRYLDGSSGAFAVSVGHGHPRVIRRIEEQLSRVAFTYRTQFETEATREIAELLVQLSPENLNRVFFVNSGSEAVETTIKLARQYWWARGKTGKQLVISRRPSYHGATLGALSCTSYAPLNIPFRPMLLPFHQITAPFCYHCGFGLDYPRCQMACANELQRVIDVLGAENVSAFIAEPIGGASTGAAVPPDEYFPIVEKICRQNDILLIIDDVLTGCGRTGTFNGYAHWNITPDLVAMSKGLSGGYSPIGAVMASDQVVEPVLASGGFMHGHTFAGNPLSCAAAAEVVKVILDEGLLENAREMGTHLHQRLWQFKDRYPIIGDVRGRGLLAGIEFVSNRYSHTPFPSNWFVANEATVLAQELGLIIYPRRSLNGLSGDHVLLAPPLTIDRAGVDEMLDLFSRTMQELTALLEQYTNREAIDLEDGTVERYQPSEAIPDYETGVDAAVAAPHANATWTMQDPALYAHGSDAFVADHDASPPMVRELPPWEAPDGPEAPRDGEADDEASEDEGQP